MAVAVGGASILGGRGHYIGTVAGAIILTLIVANLQLLSLGTAAMQISYGVILLGTVYIAGLRVAKEVTAGQPEREGGAAGRRRRRDRRRVRPRVRAEGATVVVADIAAELADGAAAGRGRPAARPGARGSTRSRRGLSTRSWPRSSPATAGST